MVVAVISYFQQFSCHFMQGGLWGKMAFVCRSANNNQCCFVLLFRKRKKDSVDIVDHNPESTERFKHNNKVQESLHHIKSKFTYMNDKKISKRQSMFCNLLNGGKFVMSTAANVAGLARNAIHRKFLYHSNQDNNTLQEAFILTNVSDNINKTNCLSDNKTIDNTVVANTASTGNNDTSIPNCDSVLSSSMMPSLPAVADENNNNGNKCNMSKMFPSMKRKLAAMSVGDKNDVNNDNLDDTEGHGMINAKKKSPKKRKTLSRNQSDVGSDAENEEDDGEGVYGDDEEDENTKTSDEKGDHDEIPEYLNPTKHRKLSISSLSSASMSDHNYDDSDDNSVDEK